MEQIYQRILKRIKDFRFELLIDVMLKRKEKETIIKKLEVVFPGRRLSSVSEEILTETIVDEFFNSYECAKIIIEYLTKLSEHQIKQVKKQNEIEAIKSIQESNSISECGKLAWAFIVDGREKLVNEATQFLDHIDKMLETFQNPTSDDNFVKTIFNEIAKDKKFKKEIKKYVESIDNIEKLQKEKNALSKENTKLHHQIDELKARIKNLQKQIGELTNEKGELKHQIEKLQKKLSDVSVEKEKSEVKFSKSELQKKIKKYEKEINKTKYELEKMSNQFESTNQELKKLSTENMSLKEQIKELEKRNKELEDENKVIKERYESLTKEQQKQQRIEQHPHISRDKRVGVFVDDESIFITIKNVYGGKKLDYEKFLTTVKGDRTIVKAIQYMKLSASEKAKGYLNFLKILGFEIRSIPFGLLNERSEFILKDIINEISSHNIGVAVIVSMNITILKKIKENLLGKDIKLEIYGISNLVGFDEKNVFFPITEDMLL